MLSNYWFSTSILVSITDKKVVKTETSFLALVVKGIYWSNSVINYSFNTLFCLCLFKVYFDYHQNFYCWDGIHQIYTHGWSTACCTTQPSIILIIIDFLKVSIKNLSASSQQSELIFR